jgi:hypothetical protein
MPKYIQADKSGAEIKECLTNVKPTIKAIVKTAEARWGNGCPDPSRLSSLRVSTIRHECSTYY